MGIMVRERREGEVGEGNAHEPTEVGERYSLNAMGRSHEPKHKGNTLL